MIFVCNSLDVCFEITLRAQMYKKFYKFYIFLSQV